MDALCFLRAVSLTSVVVWTGCFGGFENRPKTGRPSQPKKAPPAAAASSKSAAKRVEQSYGQAWQLICEAEQRAGVDPALSREARGAAVADWIVANLKNKKARYWFIGFGKVKQGRKAHFLREAVRAGIESCRLATLLFAEQPSSAPTSAPSQ